MIEAYFTRPGEFNNIYTKLLNDIKLCKNRLLMAVAYCSDEEIVKAIIEKGKDINNFDKRIILNAPDMYRNNSLAPLLRMHCNCMALGTWISEKNQSNMHHKFIICDNVLWIGSYNFTEYAKHNNWENMLRIDDEKVIADFLLEFEYMWIVGDAINTYLDKNRCLQCGKIVSDPLSHFSIVVDAGEPIGSGFPTFYVYCNREEDERKPYETKCDECGKKILSTQSIISNTTSFLEVYCLDCAYKKLWTKSSWWDEWLEELNAPE